VPELGEEAVVVGVGDCSAGDAGAGQRRRVEALRHLPGAYSLALRLREAGLPDELIAECLAVAREALEPLLDVAEAKLAAILLAERDGWEHSPLPGSGLARLDRRSAGDPPGTVQE
jgi:hypothetical protein